MSHKDEELVATLLLSGLTTCLTTRSWSVFVIQMNYYRGKTYTATRLQTPNATVIFTANTEFDMQVMYCLSNKNSNFFFFFLLILV